MTTYDALLVLSFGGPEGREDVIPYLENVLRGRPVPRARLEEVAEHYYLFDGVSPLNNQNRALIAALREDFAAHELNLPIYWGNRNWHPYLIDTLRQMQADGVKRALALFTTAYSSYSSCRQYREDIARAQAEIGDGAPEVHKLRVFYNHPGFIEPNVDHLREALALTQNPETAKIVFTAHSIPVAMAKNSSYEGQLLEASRLVAEGVGRADWQLVYQSRSGSPHQPWLEPDIGEHLRQLKADGVREVVVLPIGFISDHMEVMFDLDMEAREISDEIGLHMVRAATVGTHPKFVRMIRELILERINDNPMRVFLGTRGASHDVCPVNCCLPDAEVRGASR